MLFFPGGEIVSTFDDPENVKIGTCDLIEEVIIGEDKLIRFSGLWVVLRLVQKIRTGF